MQKALARLLFSFIILTSTLAQSQESELAAGPMLGYTTMTEVGIWLQTQKPASVILNYGETTGSLNQKLEAVTKADNAHVAHFVLSNLTPGTTYSYELSVDGKLVKTDWPLTFSTQELWQFRTDPPAFKVALGSCTFVNEPAYDRPGKGYGSDYGIFNSIANESPSAMLWLGDNIYLREVDWSNWSGYLHRYTHTRNIPEMSKLLSTTSNYAIWDDHDFGPNDGNGSWIHKDWALDAFKAFWMNPSYGFESYEDTRTAFTINDMDFFFLDNRTYRTSHDNARIEPQILGKEQIEWLIEALKFSRAPYKIVAVGGQVINTAAVYENHAQYAQERKYLLERICEERIKGVVFLSGDRHSTELSRFEGENDITIHDFTCSPLTSRAYPDTETEDNKLRVDGTFVGEHNFGILDFSGPRKERVLKASVYDKEGALLWSETIQR